MFQLICSSKNSIASQSKQYEAHDLSYSFDIHVLNKACDFSAARMQQSTLIHSIFLILLQFYLITVLLLFHSISSCASCILLSLRTVTFFKKKTFVMNTALSQLLVSLNYSSCADQIYISVCSFIALRKSSSLHSYFESICHYRVSEFSYAYKCTERCIETFLHYFHNK